jgi:23S rRNA G2069 N7-methylase RlmK/C1962 C5-methylase RlmI
MLMKAAKVANRRITFLQQSNAARDHVVSLGYPESNYLTAVLLYVH